MKRYYSLRELSQELDIPKSTIVKYKDILGEFLTLVGDGKRKKFPEETVEILGVIRDLRENHNTGWEEIKEILADRFGVPEPEPVNEQSVQVFPARLPQIDHLSHIVTTLATEMMKLSAGLDELRDKNRKHSENLRVIATHLAKTEKKLDVVANDLSKRDFDNKTQARKALHFSQREFAKIYMNLQDLADHLSNADVKPPAWLANLSKVLKPQPERSAPEQKPPIKNMPADKLSMPEQILEQTFVFPDREPFTIPEDFVDAPSPQPPAARRQPQQKKEAPAKQAPPARLSEPEEESVKESLRKLKKENEVLRGKVIELSKAVYERTHDLPAVSDNPPVPQSETPAPEKPQKTQKPETPQKPEKKRSSFWSLSVSNPFAKKPPA